MPVRTPRTPVRTRARYTRPTASPPHSLSRPLTAPHSPRKDLPWLAPATPTTPATVASEALTDAQGARAGSPHRRTSSSPPCPSSSCWLQASWPAACSPTRSPASPSQHRPARLSVRSPRLTSRPEGVAGTLSPGRFERPSGRATPRPVANRPAQPSPAWRVYAMAAPTGAPRRRSVHPGMHVPGRGPQAPGASAPSAGVCHRCVTHLPGARVAERSDALGAVEIGRHRGMRRSEDARAQPRPSSAGTGASADRTASHAIGLSRHFV